MRMIAIGLALATIAMVPAAAQEENQPPRMHTVRGQLMLYEMTNYNGASYVVDGPRSTVRTDWNIRSLSVHPGDRWQICARPRFRDPCIVLDRSVYDASLIGVDGQIGSARPAPAESSS